MAVRVRSAAVMAVWICVGAASAEVAVPFGRFDELRRQPGIVREARWDEVRRTPEAYRGKTLEYLLLVGGRIDFRGETRLITTNRHGETVRVICPGGSSMGHPKDWVAVLGQVPSEGPVLDFPAGALTCIAAPQPTPPQPTRQVVIDGGTGPNGATAMTGAGGGPFNAEGETAPAPAGAGVGPMSPEDATDGNYQAAPLATDGLVERRNSWQAPASLVYDTSDLGHLERFIASRNPGVGAADRRLMATEILGVAQYFRMRWEFLAALFAAESNFNKSARSPAGALGLGQLMPFNCRRYGVGDPFDIRQNVRASARHVSDLLDKYQRLGPQRQFVNALSAYNAGEGAVDKYNGLPPYSETINYVQKIAMLYRRLCAESDAAR